MKTIEERAKIASEGYDDDGYSAGLYIGYVEGAKEQKAIDDAILLKVKSAWEKQAQINHDNELNYQQGYHDAIEKACEWLKINWRKYVYRDRDDGILFGHWESDFRKAIEE